MHRPPSVSQFFRYPVTSALAAMAMAVTFLTHTGHALDPVEMNVLAFEGQPWRLVTSALPHADVLHLVFNVYWLWVFGTLVEAVLGPVRTLAIFVILQTGAIAAEYALLDGGIGLSGVGYGLVGMLWVLGRLDGRFRDAVDNRVLALFAIWFVFCVVTTALDVFPVANIAHGMGFVLGALGGLALARSAPLWRRIAGGTGLVVLIAASLLGASVLRPRINLSAHGGIDQAELAYAALEAGDMHEAISRYRRALAYEPENTASTYNLGIALERSGDLDAALVEYRRAHALDPNDARYTGAVQSALVTAGIEAFHEHHYDAAIRLYLESLAVGEHAIALWDLSLAYRAVGRTVDAEAAQRRALALDPKLRDPHE